MDHIDLKCFLFASSCQWTLLFYSIIHELKDIPLLPLRFLLKSGQGRILFYPQIYSNTRNGFSFRRVNLNMIPNFFDFYRRY